jgi:predicted methyltransferase
MRKIWMIGAAFSLALAGAGAPAKPAAADVTAAVADSAHRTPDNVKLDAGRKPVELLRFLGLKPGMRVADMFGGNNYWGEILAPAVGSKGRVTIWLPSQFYDSKANQKLSALATAQPNVRWQASPFAEPNLLPNQFDLMLINLDYHDVYWESSKRGIARMEPDQWLKTIYAAMKPGGIVGVVDHVGPAGDTREVVNKLHRIDPAVVRADFKRAGFKLEAESDLLRNPADDHSLLVFNPAIRGKTDRFVMKFRKPR